METADGDCGYDALLPNGRGSHLEPLDLVDDLLELQLLRIQLSVHHVECLLKVWNEVWGVGVDAGNRD